MSRIAPFLLAAFITMSAPLVQGAEGHSAQGATSLSSDRRAHYVLERATREGLAKHAAQASSKSHGETVHERAVRTSPAASARAPSFAIYDADITLLDDRDDDGYHREFRVRFDADTTSGDVRVYARLYLRRLGDAQWVHYHTTDDFWIEDDADDDDYFVTAALEDGYATDDYDVLIDLHESGREGIVATLSGDETDALGFVPMEEAGLDAAIEIAGYSLEDIATELIIDDDGDEYYSRFELQFDPDADVAGQSVYARIWLRPQGGEWFEEHVTENFIVDGNGDADVYTLTADWLEGYPTGEYDVQIDLYDANTDLLAASAGSERAALSRLPLEDATRDVRPTPPPAPVQQPSDVRTREGGGGGALGWVFTVALLTLGIGTRRIR